MRNIAIIPARSGEFDEVMVSTDFEKYAEIARKYGAKVLLPQFPWNYSQYVKASKEVCVA